MGSFCNSRHSVAGDGIMTAERILTSLHLKCTSKRRAILDFLSGSVAPVTAEEVANHIGEAAHVSTVYRFLGTLVEKGLLIREIHQDGIAYYLFPQPHHHHVLTCRLCHRSVQLPDCPLAQMEQQLEVQTGFHITGHLLEFMGVCPTCAAQEKEKQENVVQEKKKQIGNKTGTKCSGKPSKQME